MSKWKTHAGHITDGIRTVKINTAKDLVTTKIPVQQLADRLNCSKSHFIRFAILACKYLWIKREFCEHWGKLAKWQGIRLPKNWWLKGTK